MSDQHIPDDDRPEELSYEDFGEALPSEDNDLEPIDLDALDDELEPDDHDEATAEFLDSIEELDDEIELALTEKPERVTIWASEVEPEPDAALDESVPPPKEPEEPDIEKTLEDAEAQESAETLVEAEPTPPPAPDTIYHALIALPTDLGAQVLELREIGRITDTPPPGVMFVAAFRTADLPAVENALAGWARAHLPLQLEITGVVAEVIGTQQYVAAWSLQPEEELQEVQEALMDALEPLIIPLPDSPPPSRVRLTIGEHIAPQPFPKVIGAMQRDFEPYVWHAEAVSLIRLDPASESHDWEVAKSFD